MSKMKFVTDFKSQLYAFCLCMAKSWYQMLEIWTLPKQEPQLTTIQYPGLNDCFP